MLHSCVWSDDEGFFLSCRVVDAYQDAAAATAGANGNDCGSKGALICSILVFNEIMLVFRISFLFMLNLEFKEEYNHIIS